MHMVLSFALLAVASATAGETSGKPVTNKAGPVTITPTGRFLGSWMETRQGRRIKSYRGIRYAEPPTGPLRFQPPVPITHYDGDVDSSKEGPACPQPSNTPGFVTDEDCLRLNVYTPELSNSSKPLPVVVYIHPGGFYSVSGRSDYAGPAKLLGKDIVLVAINYRLGSLGFLSTGDKWAPGNNGMKDQVAALRWVQRNIRAFGGDPDLVTVAGYSAGSMSIGMHMISPMAKGLFHRAIMMSSGPLSQVVHGREQRHLAIRQAKLAGCFTEVSQRIVGCLRTRPWQAFANSLDSMFEFGFDPVLLWGPVVEPDVGQERYLVEPLMDSIRAGRIHTVPLIISQTENEFFWKAFNVLNNATLFSQMSTNWPRIAPISFMLPAKGEGEGATAEEASNTLKEAYFGGVTFKNDSNTAAALGKLYSDAVIGYSVHRTTRLMARHSPHPVYQYEFTYFGNNSHYVDSITKKPVGAVHHDELIYVLSVPAVFPEIPLGTKDNEIVEKLVDIWYNFARFGNPNPREDSPSIAGMNWPKFTPEKRQYLEIGKEFSVGEKLFEDRYDVWNKLYPVQY
ncbi:hypothetical protein O0L34_g1768 [Tuta absoluta]|nr:hypothetical protein O0L34_g1768 [Tuta absoluta]